MVEKISPLLASPFFDLELGADGTDLDNTTYFETRKKLLKRKRLDL